MDITSRRNLWEILKKITEKRIIILTTHYMEEASVLGSRIGILAEGNMKCIGTPLFLIEKFGKSMSVNIFKEVDAEDAPIINFIQSKAEGIEYEKLSEEILFKIPKGAKGFDIKTFFEELDANTEALGIKNYSASMPTLEDVFLNVAVMKKEGDEEDNAKFNEHEEENDRIMFFQKYEADYTGNQKFCSDIGILFYKRFKQVYRDMKTFFLEIICPIILTVIGCVVVQVDIFKDTEPLPPDLNIFGKQKIYYGKINNSEISFNKTLLDTVEFVNVTSEVLDYEINPQQVPLYTERIALQDYMDSLFQRQEYGAECFGSLFFTEENTAEGKYEMFELINPRGRQAPAYYSPYFLKKVLANHGINFDYTHYPLPMTEDIKGYGKSLNNFCLVFFVSIAFGLIPCNFISSIVRERINNSKHLMRIAGVSLFAYWTVNYIFEVVKYYVTAGVCMLILWAFDFVPDYFYIVYLLYGPCMVSVTYLMSYWFDNEGYAQNGLILFNLVLGSLGSTVCIMLRSLEDTTEGAKPVAYVLRIIPSFAFGYAYNQLLNGKLILFLDYGVEYRLKKSSEYLKMKYVGADFVYMAIEAVLYMVILSIIESKSYTFNPCPDDRLESNVKDPAVVAEIERANNQEYVRKLSRKKSMEVEIQQALEQKKKSETEGLNVQPQKVYSVKLKNIRKVFSKGCCSGEKAEAIKNLSFCIEYGECFGLLGLNGAGKTT
ncbi:MAG: ABC transporter permease, partial [archaeon]|nr:ABC transporter permease [archaeon]